MTILKYNRKVLSLGSSLALTIPNLYIKLNNIKKSKEMYMFFNIEDIIILCPHNDDDLLKNSLTNFLDELKKCQKQIN